MRKIIDAIEGDLPVIGLGDAARDAGQGIAVAAQGDGLADGVFEG